MTGLRLPEELDHRLSHLSHETKRSKNFYIRKALQEYLAKHEDYLLASASYEDYLKRGKKGLSLIQLQKKYDLNDD